jgi:hypothetical protein
MAWASLREAAMFKKIYLAGALATFVYLMVFDGFAYSHGNRTTQTAASFAASMLWPAYWAAVRWL